MTVRRGERRVRDKALLNIDPLWDMMVKLQNWRTCPHGIPGYGMVRRRVASRMLSIYAGDRPV